ncbi:hypothetical protein [Clostridium sp. YIM B02555]|uniref:hypothetical protein n=1 Tax=Clostridium sp. YIM B02555 TaxID=2911968 RepID=UPI001EED4A1B|nr:hypothetical protein [Clostridium sp. YIM B02555]
MELTLSVIIACGTAITAIIAPIFTALINNHYQLKLKNTDLFYNEKSDIYKRFCINIEHLDSWVHELNENIINEQPINREYLEIHKLAYLMSNDKIRALLDELSSHFNEVAINEEKYEALKKKIIKSMNKDLHS